MKPGTKPAPTPLKLLKGTRPSRVNAAAPSPPPGLPECPDYLDDVARAEWGRIAPILARMGVFTPADEPALALYCDAFSEWRAAKVALKAEGVGVTSRLGAAKTNPHVNIAAKAREVMLRILAEFGCTPSSRSRVSTRPEGPAGELDDFLARKGGRIDVRC